MTSARDLTKYMEGNAEFIKQLEKAKTSEEKDAVIRDAGFDCSQAELSEALSELSDDDMDAVSGGMSAITW